MISCSDVDRPTMLAVVSLLDWIYRLGVSDAYIAQDEGLVREFCEKTSQAGVFGFITDDYTIEWKEWALRLMAKSRMDSWNGAMTRLFRKAGKYGTNFLSVFINIAQCYYNKGLKDCIEVGTVDMAKFAGQKKVLLTPTGFRNCDVREYVETMQLISFDLERRDKAIWESSANEAEAMRRGALRPKHYNLWRNACRLAMPNAALL